MSNSDSTVPTDVDLLSAYLDNQLAPNDRITLEDRLGQDASLRQSLHELRVTVDLLHELEPVRPPRSFALDPAAVQPNRSFWQLPANWMRLGSVVAALLLAITFTLDVSGRGAPSTAQAPANAQTASEAEVAGGTASKAAPTSVAEQEAAPAAALPAADSRSMGASAAATPAPVAQADAAAAEATVAAAEGAISMAAPAPTADSNTLSAAAAAEQPANSPAIQSSGSTASDTTSMQSYTSEKPQLVAIQQRPLLVIELALGALALLLLAGSFWLGRRKA